ncbi:capsular polysaccharide export protein, LipB/KpsS family [Domibacillus epiphyticus]|uniref:Capsular biosynthesis protein n=1 Tax=Domibacillus epiphyticus TaxID=1714355 RepID=A0A1V2A5A8_9BACI|nr:hypothetical protein [Domibacillus epiphyticus]OMP66117.1 hypothetical protein BTO28_14020 [Domibacillus epiphyticus]
MKILINISNSEDYGFFQRFYEEFYKKNIEIEYLANNLFIYLFLKIKREKIYLIKKDTYERFDEVSFSELTKRLTHEEAEWVYGSFKKFMEKQYKKRKWDLVIIPSGRLINQIAISDVAEKYNIKTLYVGYGNIPDRTFVDPQGTDKQSSLFSNINILNNYQVTEKEYNSWREEYLTKKFKSHKIGQARNLDAKVKIKKFIQINFCYLERIFGIAAENSYHFSDMKTFKKVEYQADTFDYKEEFIFFPMQVSTDAQIILNYNKKNILDGLKEAIRISKEKRKRLVIKMHPAEINQDVICEVLKLKEKENIIISSNNTFELIKKSSEVITINSTVGLESRIVGKKVTFLGDSIYKNMNNQQMKNYIMSYLLHMEYFSSGKISRKTYEEFINRAGMGKKYIKYKV